MVGDLYMTVQEARWYRARFAKGEFPEGVTATFTTHDDYERDLVRKYPIVMAIRAYEIEREAFERAKDDFGLYPTDTKTMGIMGGDGGIGWTPAMAWEHESDAYNGSFGSCYVTPWPETVRPITHGHSWERVTNAIYNHYR